MLTLKPIPRGTVPTLAELFARYSVLGPSRNAPNNVQNGWEVIDAPIFDTETYAAAGQLNLSFFTTGQNTEGEDKTNLQGAGGQLPAQQYQLVRGLSTWIIPGENPVTVANSAAAQLAVVTNFTNDIFATYFSSTARRQFKIANKVYVNEPARNFTPRTSLNVSAAAALNYTQAAAATGESQYTVDVAHIGGVVRDLDVPFLLEPQESFTDQDVWKAVVATPSTQPMTVVHQLDGLTYRSIQ